MRPPLQPKNRNRLIWRSACALALGLLAGCGSDAKPTLDVYLDELEFQSSLESTCEIQLGNYGVASALQMSDKHQQVDDSQWVYVRFRLVAVVDPRDEKSIEKAIARHRGLIDDTVITVCRRTTKEELADSRWATFKSRLIDAIRPILGEERLRQISFVDFSYEAI